MAGRPPKPTGAKILQGTFRKGRQNLDEPQFVPLTEIPAPPRKLKAEAKREWDRVIEYVIKNNLCGAEGLSILATYCSLHAVIVSDEKKGEFKAAILAQYRALAERFALDPSSRAKVHVKQRKTESANPWEALK
jgi:phage terminase small subunit